MPFGVMNNLFISRADFWLECMGNSLIFNNFDGLLKRAFLNLLLCNIHRYRGLKDGYSLFFQ